MSETYVYPWCDVPRWDFIGEQPAVPDCDHAVCLQDIAGHREGLNHLSDWECPSGQCALCWLESTCELPVGHTGDHDFGVRPAPGLNEWCRLPSPAGAAEREGASS